MLDDLSQTLRLAVTGVAVGLVYKALRLIYQSCTSPLKNLPGPRHASLIFGNMKELWRLSAMTAHERWVKQHGPVFVYRLLGSRRRLYVADVKGLNHVLGNTDLYRKPEAVSYSLSRLVGGGVLVVEGEKHRRQRKVMNPAFGPAQIRQLTSIFVDKAIELRDVWANTLPTDADGSIDVLSWLSRTTLDIIGLAGFNYHFNALKSDPRTDRLNQAFSHALNTNLKFSMIPALRALFPSLRFLPTSRDKDLRKSQNVMREIAEELLNDSRQAILAEHSGKVEKDSWQAKDLLSLLLKANMATDLQPHQRMSDEDVLAQVPTFLIAGHETTSTATTWALFALTQAPVAQATLREEVLSFPRDKPTMDELNTLPYLDAVIREALRLYPPVVSTRRVATRDDIIPLAEKLQDKSGQWIDHIQVKKGQEIYIPITMINRLPSLWGDDAEEFRPERWLDVPEKTTHIPGVWGNMLTFLGGPRACIGFRFSVIEMKALLFVLTRAFEFELAVPAEQISRKVAIVQRPVVKDDPTKTNRMPLILRPVQT